MKNVMTAGIVVLNGYMYRRIPKKCYHISQPKHIHVLTFVFGAFEHPTQMLKLVGMKKLAILHSKVFLSTCLILRMANPLENGHS